jgi:hypothetical protein
MLPYEREIYLAILIRNKKDELEKQKQAIK